MRFAAKFFIAAKYIEVNSQLADLLQALFLATGQTKLVEDAIQKLRDHETRDSTNKSMARMNLWEHLVTHKLWSQHRRSEVEPSTSATPLGNFGATLFVPVSGESGEGEFEQGLDEEKLDLQRVMGKVDWVRFDAQLQQEHLGEVQCPVGPACQW